MTALLRVTTQNSGLGPNPEGADLGQSRCSPCYAPASANWPILIDCACHFKLGPPQLTLYTFHCRIDVLMRYQEARSITLSTLGSPSGQTNKLLAGYLSSSHGGVHLLSRCTNIGNRIPTYLLLVFLDRCTWVQNQINETTPYYGQDIPGPYVVTYF